MTRSTVHTRLLIAVALLAPVSGCAGMGAQLLAGGEEIIEYGTPSEYLSCPQTGEAPPADTQVVGPEGRRLQSGIAGLTIPAGALLAERRFIFRQDSLLRAGATIDLADRDGPARFQTSAILRIDLSGCTPETLANPRGWWVWRVNTVDGPSQKLRTEMSAREATTVIDSASRFMIAN
jgi:hypothetical protein